MNYHSGYRYQRGKGIGSIFSGFLKTLRPLFFKTLNVGKKLLTSDAAKKFGSQMLDIGKTTAQDVLVDVLEGKNFSDASAEKLEEAKAKIAKTLKGGGSGSLRKRKKLKTSKTNSKKVKYNLLDND